MCTVRTGSYAPTLFFPQCCIKFCSQMLLELLKIPKSIENNFLFKDFWGGGGVGGMYYGEFEKYVAVFRNDLPSVESL